MWDKIFKNGPLLQIFKKMSSEKRIKGYFCSFIAIYTVLRRQNDRVLFEYNSQEITNDMSNDVFPRINRLKAITVILYTPAN